MTAPSLVVLTGAGVSADSGVDTFRTKGGLWDRYDWRDVATPEGFAANPGRVYEFYDLRRAGLPTVRPNPAHEALAALEARLEAAGGRLTLVTQNVDDLHQRAGSRRVLPIHGRIDQALCPACGGVHHWPGSLGPDDACPGCGQTGLRPNVVWFGEVPYHLEAVEDAMAEADIFVQLGTSGAVYPAAGLAQAAAALGLRRVELNLEPSDNAVYFDETHYGPAAQIVPRWAKELTW